VFRFAPENYPRPANPDRLPLMVAAEIFSAKVGPSRKEEPMAHYVARIPVTVTRSAAFEDLSRFDRAAEWDPGVEAGEMLTPEPVGVGSRFRLVARFLGRRTPLVYEIVDLERDERIVLRAENRSVRSVDTITFQDDDRGSVVVYDAQLHAKGIGRLADPLLAIVFRRIGDRAAAGLRTHLSAVQA
jgi:Polyketide cyclase / dehydrase and lipid transport